jgi:hypothetical protein
MEGQIETGRNLIIYLETKSSIFGFSNDTAKRPSPVPRLRCRRARLQPLQERIRHSGAGEYDLLRVGQSKDNRAGIAFSVHNRNLAIGMRCQGRKLFSPLDQHQAILRVHFLDAERS